MGIYGTGIFKCSFLVWAGGELEEEENRSEPPKHFEFFCEADDSSLSSSIRSFGLNLLLLRPQQSDLELIFVSLFSLNLIVELEFCLSILSKFV